jgi:hypothetical protein
MTEEEIPVEIHCNLTALKRIHRCVALAHKNWPGGDPYEQADLDQLSKDLYVILYNYLFFNDLI